MRLAGSVAVVTGASSGIGRATVLDLCVAGVTVVAVARRAERLEALVEEVAARGRRAQAAVCDVADRGAVDDLAERLLSEHQHVDILVNNAGIPLHGSFRDSSVEQIEQVTRVNYMGAVYWMKALLPGMMQRRRGAIVNVASVAGAMPYPWEAAYSASKAALIALSEAVAPEAEACGVRVGWVNPGQVRTEIWSDESLRHVPRTGLSRWQEPEAVSAAIVDAVARDRVGVTVPRVLGATTAVRFLAPPLFRRGIRRIYREAVRRDAGR